MSRLGRELLLLSSILSIAACATGLKGDEASGSDGAGGGSAAGSGSTGATSSGPSAQGSGSGSASSGQGGSGQGGSGGPGAGSGGAATSSNAGAGPSTGSTGSGSGASSSSTGAGAAGGAGSCGDGTIGGVEQCDDGDTLSGDGCSASCSWETNCQSDNPHPSITCGQTINGDFFGTYGDIQNLCGKPFLYQDQIFVFSSTTGATVTVTYTASPDQPDMAMFVMEGSCHSGLCFADSTSDANRHDVTFQAKPGITYYIDLEAPSQQPSYSITLQCN